MNVQSKPSKLIKGSTGDWEVVIGMEVHAQVTSQSKLFSGASTELMSGLGEPAFTSTATHDLARSTRLPAAELPSLMGPSIEPLDMMSMS